ncbi:MAG: hypothetical protein H6680_09965 [Desulfobacteraceae bacterium]|nr:hypothetical protein [Desulfobacteraceae bacterium]
MEYFAKYTYFFAMMLYASAFFVMYFKKNIKIYSSIKSIFIAALAVHTISLFSYIILCGYVPMHKRTQYMIPRTWGLSIILVYTWIKYESRLLTKIMIFTVLAMFFIGFPVPAPSEFDVMPGFIGIRPFLWFHIYDISVVLFAYCFCLSIAWFLIKHENSEGNAKSLMKRIHSITLWGFVFFTLSQIAGSAWAIIDFGDYWHWKPMHLMSVAIWMFYGAMVHVKYVSGLSKKVLPVMGTIGFLCVMWWGIYHDFSKVIVGYIKGVLS